MAREKKDPVVSTGDDTVADTSAPALENADDYAGDREYKDNPDKPSPDSVAQIEVTD